MSHQKEKTIEELEKLKSELRGFIDYHVLTAAKYLSDIHHIEDKIKEMENNRNKPKLSESEEA